MAVPEGYTALGTVGIAYKGEYSGGTTYKYLNCVYHNGSTYVAMKEVTGIEPTDDGENWKYLAQGVVGAAAGFGDITATVDGTSGTPAVTVETGEDNTAMDITFKFTGLKGADGEDGTPGTNGDPGADGKTWKPSVSEEGVLTWTQDDSTEPPAEANIKGKDGTNGTDGTPGAPGKDGTSVTKVEVRDGHLYVTLDEAEPQDVGEILPAEPKHKKLTTTLVSTKWQGEAFPFTYQIELPDVTAQQSVIVAIPEKLTEAEIEAFSKACITPYAQEEGSITLQAVEKPAIDLKIIIEIGGELEEVSFIMLDVTADAGSTVSATEVEGAKETVQGGTVGEEGVLSFNLPRIGRWTVLGVLAGQSGEETVMVKEHIHYPVTLQMQKKPLEQYTWDEIAQAAEDHTAKNLFKIGDEKKFTLTGEYAQELTLQIAGFDYDDLTDESGKAGITFITKEIMKDDKCINNNINTNWTETEMYTTILPAIFDCFPEDLKPHVKEINKGSVLHRLFLLSKNECFDETKKYPIFTDDASRSKKKASGEADGWFLREPSDFDESYYTVENDGTIYGGVMVLTPSGVVFAFCI